MSDHLPDRLDADAPIFVISVAAQLADMHPQTLRGYDRLGLVVPGRARGRGRRYSLRDIARLGVEGIKEYYGLLPDHEDVNLRMTGLFFVHGDMGEADALARLAEPYGPAADRVGDFWRAMNQAAEIFPWYASWFTREIGKSKPDHAMTAAFICSQCGLCEFACPMQLSPKRAYAELLRQFRAGGMKNPLTAKPDKVHEFRKYRKIGKDRMTKRYALAQFDRHDLPLSRMEAPARVRLSLTQSLGAPSKPVVNEGDKVKTGDWVARIPDRKLGSNLHASIDGTVTSVDKGFIVIERSRKR